MKYTGRVLAAVLLALAMLSATLGAPAQAAGGDEVDITDSNVAQVLQSSSSKPLIVMVGATWCSYCKQLYPSLQRANQQAGGQWRLAHLEADLHKSAARRFSVSGYPTTFGYSNGSQIRSVQPVAGNMSSSQISSFVQRVLSAWNADHPGGGQPTTAPTSAPTPTWRPTTGPTPTWRPTTRPTPTSDPTAGEGEVLVTDGNVEQVLAASADKPVIVLVGATWSGFTNKLLPKLQARHRADQASWTLALVYADRAPNAVKRFGAKAYPTVMGYSNGKEITSPGRFADGNMSQENVNRWVQQVGDAWRRDHGNNPQPSPTTDPLGRQVDVTDANVAQVLAESTSRPVVMIVGATWSGFTRQLLPRLQAKHSADGGTWTLAVLYADKAPKAAAGITVQAYPTVMGFSDSSEMAKPPRFADGRRSQALVNQWVDTAIASWEQAHGGGNEPGPEPTGAPSPTTAPGDGQLPALPEGAVQVTSVEQFKQAVIEESKKRPVVIDFSKDMCEPCLALAPILDKQYLADNGAWQYVRIDGTEVKDVWAKYDNPWFPTLLAIKDGKELGRYSGFDGRAEPVIEFLKKAKAGEETGSDPLVMSIDNAAAWKQAKEISARHPVVVRLHMDDSIPAVAEQGKAAAAMANGDGGKWTLANVQVMGPMYNTIAQEMGAENIQGPPAVHIIMYQGIPRTEDDLTVLRQAKPDDKALRDWVNAMLSHHYKPAT